MTYNETLVSHNEKLEAIKTMVDELPEASSGSEVETVQKLVTEIILYDQDWVVPDGVTSVNVRLFGAGGSGSSGLTSSRGCGNGGCGGYMETGSFEVTPGDVIPITIGEGGWADRVSSTTVAGEAGGASSFGTLLTA